MTISVGAAHFLPSADASPQLLLKQADAALYQAKHAGRNRVQIASYDTSRPAAEL